MQRRNDNINVLCTDVNINIKVDNLPYSCSRCPFKRELIYKRKVYDPNVKDWVDMPENQRYYILCCRYMMRPPVKRFRFNWMKYYEDVYEDLVNNRWSKCPLSM